MYTLQNGAVNAGFIFFSLAILATLVFGRYVCGWGCHVLALQDLCSWLLQKIGLKPKPFRSRILIYVPLLFALYMFVWPTVLRAFTKAPADPLIPAFTNHIITTDFWATFPPVAVAIPFLFICGFVVVYFLGSKGFCTYGCPYGGFFAVADKVAPGKIRVTDACNQCGHCTAVCTSNVLVHAEVKAYGAVVDPGCMKCMDCVSVCPNEALHFGFGKPAVTVKKTLKTNYSVTWAEEIIGAVAFFAGLFCVWDVYQLVPMLMAIGIAVVTAYLAVRTVRLLTSGDLAFYRHALKSGGKIRKAGWAFLGFSLLWFGLSAHSGFVRYYEAAGARGYEKVRIPDELALATADPREWLSDADRAAIESGKTGFYAARSIGLFSNVYAISKLAWLEYLSGNTDRALALLAEAGDKQYGENRALSLYYRGAILNRLGRGQEALASLDASLAERADLILAREERGVALWQLGRRSEAVNAWADALRRNPRLALSSNFLAGAAAAGGQKETAAAWEAQADRITPNDALFNWMLGQRLRALGMERLAEKHFERARTLGGVAGR
jgi:polyferredoxin/tetratricopeptide (TPR) repeat protein